MNFIYSPVSAPYVPNPKYLDRIHWVDILSEDRKFLARVRTNMADQYYVGRQIEAVELGYLSEV